MVKKKIATILKSQSGASLAFYLAIMFFLMAIAGSVLASASTAAGIAGERRKDVQLDIYVESVVKSLNETIVNGDLGKNIVSTMYAASPTIDVADPTAPPVYLADFKIEANVSAVVSPAELKIEDIDINFSPQNVVKIPELTDEGGIILSPAMGSINFQMESLVTGEYLGKTLKVKTTYSYFGEETGGTPIIGTWQVVSYEKLDQG